MVEKFVQVDGLRIRYLEEGSGPAVIPSTALLWVRPPMFGNAIFPRLRATV